MPDLKLVIEVAYLHHFIIEESHDGADRAGGGVCKEPNHLVAPILWVPGGLGAADQKKHSVGIVGIVVSRRPGRAKKRGRNDGQTDLPSRPPAVPSNLRTRMVQPPL